VRSAVSIFFVLLMIGCASHRRAQLPPSTVPTTQLADWAWNADVDAYVAPPIGWRADPLKSTSRHNHQVWVAPSDRTAYGVIRFSLPLPVGTDVALWGFLREMRRTEGEAILLDKQWDQNLDALRFVADGGIYRVRVNLFVDGWRGWAVYAGTRRDHPIAENELEVAERAREHTVVGVKQMQNAE
jgi:hypothetical protein